MDARGVTAPPDGAPEHGLAGVLAGGAGVSGRDPGSDVLTVVGAGGALIPLTAGDWMDGAAAMAAGLARRGVGPGDAVGLWFHPAAWIDFAVAALGVIRAGAGAILVPAGAAAPERDRALRHARAVGLVRPAGGAGDPDPTPPTGPWLATVEELRGEDGGRPTVVSRPARTAVAGYPATALAPPRPWRLEPGGGALADLGDGVLVHAWAPGTWAATATLDHLLRRPAAAALSLDRFDPDRLCAVAASTAAATLGLPPALAAGLVASGAPGRHDLSAVRLVVLSGAAGDGLAGALRAALPQARLAVLAPAPRPGAGHGPVAVSQESMLWHEQFSPGSFNLPCLHRRFRGPLDVDALRRAVTDLVRRHEPLRTTFDATGGRPRQRAAPPGATPPVPLLDLGGLDEAERDRRVGDLLAEATRRRFDLVDGPLFEPQLVRLGPDDHLLAVRLHHTVFDDWSVDVFRRELAALYAARTGSAAPPEPPPVGFLEVARRRRARLDGAVGRDQRAWWADELHGAPLSLQLPLGDPDAPAGGGGGPAEPLRHELPAPVAAGVRVLAPRLRATPYMTVLAAFGVLVHQLTGQDDLLLSSVVAHRDRTEVEPLVGCFTKKVPLRLRVGGDPTFAELVTRARTALLGSMTHHEVSFDAAVQEGVGRAAADHGVVPQPAVVFQGETPRKAAVGLPGVEAGGFEAPVEAREERHFSARRGEGDEAPAAAWGDGIYLGTFLILSLVESEDGLALVARGSFHRPAGRRLLERLESLLADVVAGGPDRTLSALAGTEAGGSAAPDDVIELRGLRASRSRLESALRASPGVEDVALVVDHPGPGGEPRLVAVVVPDGDGPPALHELRAALWSRLPGALWPAAVVAVGAIPRTGDAGADAAVLARAAARAPTAPADPSPTARLVAAAWAEVRGRPAGTAESYWQEFSFLEALAELRQAGWDVPDDLVARCRTPDMLAAALDARAPLDRRPAAR